MPRDCTALLIHIFELNTDVQSTSPGGTHTWTMPNGKSKSAARRAKRANKAVSTALVPRKNQGNGDMSTPRQNNYKSINNFNQSNMSTAITAAPTAFSRRMAFGPSNGRSASMRSVSKTEFITGVNGSVAFETLSLNINPGMANVFPWLSNIAKDWQQYRFKRFQARFITRSSTSERGTVILSPEYSISEGPPTNEQDALDTQDAVEDVVWKELVCQLDPSAMNGIGPRKLIRQGNVPGDLTLYDSAILTVATVGQVAPSVVGRLYFDYEIDFYVPQSTNVFTIVPRVSAFEVYGFTVLTSGVSYVIQNWVDSYSNSNQLGVNPAGLPGGAFVLSAGNYLVTATVLLSDGNVNTDLATALSIIEGGSLTDPSPTLITVGTDTYNSRVSLTRQRIFRVTASMDSFVVSVNATTTTTGALSVSQMSVLIQSL